MSVFKILKNTNGHNGPFIEDGEFVNPYSLMDVVTNWPTVTSDEEDSWGPPESEDLDLENWEIISINDTQMVFAAGGDWQEPMTFTLVEDPDFLGKLKVIDIKSEFDIGLSNDEIIKIINNG